MYLVAEGQYLPAEHPDAKLSDSPRVPYTIPVLLLRRQYIRTKPSTLKMCKIKSVKSDPVSTTFPAKNTVFSTPPDK